MVLQGVKSSLGKIRKRFGEKPKLAFFVDGPNMIRKEFNLDLKDLRKRVEKYGRIIIGKVFLNQFASEKLIEAVANEGFENIIALGDPEQKTDVDVSICVHAMEAIYNPDIEVIALASRDADFLPLIQKAKENGKITVLVTVESGLAVSLKHASDFVELL
ncbi:MAG: NYN domain-containing protein [Candidatus Aenigmarchaeota archaeon]|nr:NYN domain-containing protein [Candidatus Aenigmarchaeota archaeon]